MYSGKFVLQNQLVFFHGFKKFVHIDVNCRRACGAICISGKFVLQNQLVFFSWLGFGHEDLRSLSTLTSTAGEICISGKFVLQNQLF